MKLSNEELDIRVQFLQDDLAHTGTDTDLERRIITAHVIKWHESSYAKAVENLTLEHGWLLERDKEGPEWLGIDNGTWFWTKDSTKALRLSRREDGDSLSTIVDDAWKITEHMWG